MRYIVPKQRLDPALLEPLRANPMFAKVKHEHLAQLVRHASRVRYRAGRKILREGDEAGDVFLLVSGGVRIYHLAPDRSGGEIVVKLFRAPAFFGEMELLIGISWLETVETVLPSEVIRIRGAAFKAMLQKDQSLAMALIKDLALRLCIATEHARVLAFSSAEARLASLMVDHVNLFGARDESNGFIRLDVKLSQEVLARSLAVSRKTINQTIGAWSQRGIMMKQAGRYFVQDLDALQALAIEATYGLAYELTAGGGSTSHPAASSP